MALNQDSTGRPPAVTAEMIARWQALAEDVHAALDQGGERGMDLLLSIMPEWREAVEDINAAWRISVDMAMKGMRDEALYWHAEQFSEASQALTVRRVGWDAWEAELLRRGVIVPAVDHGLSALFDDITEQKQIRDSSGATLGDWLIRLRQNVLARGPLDQRLVILQAIQRLQPADQIWEEMITPIRKQRAGKIGEEANAAIAVQDFIRLAELREEVRGWDPGLLGSVAFVLDAAGHWQRAWELRSTLATALNEFLARAESLVGLPEGFPSHSAALEAARAARGRFQQVAYAVREGIVGAEKVATIRAQIAASGLVEAYKKAEAAAKEPYQRLAEQDEGDSRRKRMLRREAQIREHIDRVPGYGSGETLKKDIPQWITDLEELRRKLKNDLDKAGLMLSPSAQELLDQAAGVERAARERLRRIWTMERSLIGIVTVVILIAVGAAIIAIIWGQR
jgi:hypothetical protein